jgi:signal transduction histidine kinase
MSQPQAPLELRTIDDPVRRAEERHRAWLHDTVLQVLEYLASGGYGQCTDPEQLMAVAARAADELRERLDAPLEPASTADFEEALEEVVSDARSRSPIDVHLDIDDLDDPVAPEVGREIVAVVREALTNTRKHSGARTARVACSTRDGLVEVQVVDDGHGFDPRSVRERLGMRCSMRERMASCGGTVAIASAPGRGVLVRITAEACPVESREPVA